MVPEKKVAVPAPLADGGSDHTMKSHKKTRTSHLRAADREDDVEDEALEVQTPGIERTERERRKSNKKST